MSTTTSYDDVTTAVQSGVGGANSWVTSNLTSSTTNSAYVQTASHLVYVKNLDLSIPDFMSGILPGSEFVSMNVKFKAYASFVATSDSFYRFSIRRDGVETYTTSVYDTSTSFKIYSGTASTFGFTGTVQQIITDLADGSIVFRFLAQNTYPYNIRFNLADFQVQLVYSAPDTKRASIISCLA